MTIHVLGAVWPGSRQRFASSRRVGDVVVHEKGADLGASASWLAGGMLAP